MTKFEKASEIVSDNKYPDLKENCIYWLNEDEYATVNFCQRRYRTKIESLAKKYPDEVHIISDTKDALIAAIPVKAVKTSIVKKGPTEVTDARIEILAAAREARLSNLRDRN